jgi:imidazolonepropionase-like amidohydrolase
MNLRAVVTLTALACALPASTTGQSTQPLVITHATVINGTGAEPLRDQTVVIAGNRIDRIGPSRSVDVPRGARVLDATGQFLIPGLWDMHVHVGEYQEGRQTLRRLLAYGITGIRDMASPLDDILRLEREIDDGTILGPQMVVAGPILQGPLPFALPPLVRTVTEQNARATVAELRSRGVDFIKVGDTLSREQYLAIAAESRRSSLPFAGHLPVTVSASEAARAGQRSIEHFGSAGFRGMLIACSSDEAELGASVQKAMAAARAGGASPDDTVYAATFTARLVETYDRRKAAALFALFAQRGTWHVPTFAALLRVWEAKRNQLNADQAAALDRVSAKTQEMFADMRREGVKVLAGSDLPSTGGPPPLHDELVALVNAGMTPMAALQAATRSPAEFLGRLATDGTVQKGRRANLVLLDADPLMDIKNARRVSAVVLDGRLLQGAELLAMR